MSHFIVIGSLYNYYLLFSYILLHIVLVLLFVGYPGFVDRRLELILGG